jgi:spore germination protein KB
MNDREVISGRQLILLVFTFIIATGTLFIPTFVAQNAGRDGWMSVLIGGLVGVVVTLVVTAVGFKFPDKTLIEYSEIILGKWVGKIIGVIFIFFYIHLTSIVVREISTTIHGTLIPKTSFESITIIIFIACAYCVKKGLEVITRVNVLVLVMIYIAIFTILFLLLKDIDIKLLTPVLSHGISPVLKDSAAPAGWFGEVVSIAFLIPFINKPKEARLHSIVGVVWAAITLAIMTALCVMIFGSKLTALLTFPTLEAVRYINLNDYIERIEILFLIPWILSTYIKICFYYYISVLITSKIFKIKTTKTLVLPIGLVIFSLSLVLFDNSVDLFDFLSRVWGLYSLPIELGIPTLLFVVALLRNKGGRKSEA